MSAERAVHAAVRVRISLSDKLDGMLDQAAVGIEDEGAGEIPNQVAAARVELRGHEEQTSVAKAAHIVYVPFVGDEPDFFRRSVEYGVALDPCLAAQESDEHARNDVPPSHCTSALLLRPTRPCRRPSSAPAGCP